jgi:hypothetical protein
VSDAPILTLSKDVESPAGSGLAAVDGAGGVAVSKLWALAAIGIMPTMAIASVRAVGSRVLIIGTVRLPR